MPAKRVPPRTMPDRWEDSADVVVVGYGYAGAVAAIEAHDAGASVLILEKMPDPGGISITSGGNVRIVDDAEQGFQHLKATNDGTTPDSVLRALAVGMQQMPAYFDKIAKASSAVVDRRQADGNYPFPGTKTFGYVSIKEIPGFDAAAAYPFVSSYVPIHRAAGVRLFRVIEDNIRQRGIRLLLSTPALRLITDEAGEIRGLTAERDGTVDPHSCAARGGARLWRLRGQPRDAAPALAGEAGAQRRLYGQYRRRHCHGSGCRRRALAHVALPRCLRLQAP